MKRLAKALIPLLFWLLVWQVAATAVGKVLLLPAPIQVARRLTELALTAAFWRTAALSLARVFGGVLAGVLAGALLAGLTCAFAWADCLLSPAVRVLRATPVASFILLILLWTPNGVVPVTVSALMVLPVVWGNVTRGVAETDPLLLEMAGAYHFGRWRTLLLVYLPSVSPYFFSALRTGMGLAWKAGVAAEVLCLPRMAIGSQIYFSKLYLETPDLFAWTLVVVALSFLLESLVDVALGRLRRHRGE